jgi:saccharopine dehydrogenase (NADP+, L-glutamate forming)
LIDYLLKHAPENEWNVVVGDLSIEVARARVQSPGGKAVAFDIRDESSSHRTIESSDIVISLLPPNLHPLVVQHCIALRKHFLNASYISDEMTKLHQEASDKGLLFLNECGLDPGIDHMSAMHLIDKIKSEGGILTSFESFAGGLITPDTDPGNPWRYKFTWNPRNVVMAGQGTAKFLMNGKLKYVPYHQVFKRKTAVTVSGTLYEGYPNRDSLKYLTTYGLQGIQTMLRGTLRNAGFCSAWNVLVQLGCCDDSYEMDNVAEMSHHDFIDSFLDAGRGSSLEEKLSDAFGIDCEHGDLQRLRWSGFFSDEKIGLTQGTPAKILEHILNKRWRLQRGDKDLIVMLHRLGYTLQGSARAITAHMRVTGDDEIHTAMAKTVGLPLGIAAKLLLQGKIRKRGVVIPIIEEVYRPVLAELESLGIAMVETQMHL